jgi:hypothetical protein
VDTVPEPLPDSLPDAEEMKPWLLLFLGGAREILASVRMIARKNEQEVRALLREDPPSAPQEPHSPQPLDQEMDLIEIEDEPESACLDEDSRSSNPPRPS